MPRRSPIFEACEYLGFRALAGCAAALPHRTAASAGAAIGLLGYLLRIRRTVIMQNLRNAYPETGEQERFRIARGAFRNYGIALVEMMWSGGAAAEELRGLIVPVNPDVFAAAYARGKGVILLSGHYGSWELTASAVPMHLPAKLIIVAQTQRNRRVNDFIDSRRTRFGNRLVSMRDAPKEILRSLARGGIAAMLGDQSGASESPFVEFFGRPAATHRGPALFALKSGAPLVMYFLVRRDDGRYALHFEEIDRTGLSGTLDEQVLELTRRHVRVLEQYIRRHPDHWLWMHKRWKHTEDYLRRTGRA